MKDKVNIWEYASYAWRITCSPVEWSWTQEEQEKMARAVVEFSRRIHKASVAFCDDGPDGRAAANMLEILLDCRCETQQRETLNR